MIRLATIACTRTAVHALLWTVLLVFAIGSHASLHVCTGGCCSAPATPEPTSCCAQPVDEAAEASCCCSGANLATAAGDCCAGSDGEEGEGDGERVRRQPCRNGCCLDLQLTLEDGPLPRRVGLDEHPTPVVAAVLPPRAPFVLDVVEPEPCAPATGPPRRDRRTALLSSTVLRL